MTKQSRDYPKLNQQQIGFYLVNLGERLEKLLYITVYYLFFFAISMNNIPLKHDMNMFQRCFSWQFCHPEKITWQPGLDPTGCFQKKRWVGGCEIERNPAPAAPWFFNMLNACKNIGMCIPPCFRVRISDFICSMTPQFWMPDPCRSSLLGPGGMRRRPSGPLQRRGTWSFST